MCFYLNCLNHLASGDSAKFAMNPVTAAVYLKEPLDFETAQTHTITAQVADEGITPQKMSTATLTINVLNTNDNKPVSQIYNITYRMFVKQAFEGGGVPFILSFTQEYTLA